MTARLPRLTVSNELWVFLGSWLSIKDVLIQALQYMIDDMTFSISVGVCIDFFLLLTSDDALHKNRDNHKLTRIIQGLSKL